MLGLGRARGSFIGMDELLRWVGGLAIIVLLIWAQGHGIDYADELLQRFQNRRTKKP
jgi:hypothetical protein